MRINDKKFGVILYLCTEKIFRKAIDKIREGIIVNEVDIKKLRYADDKVLLAIKHGIKINITNFSKNKNLAVNVNDIRIDGQIVGRVQTYTYFICWVNEKSELKSRTEQCRMTFKNMH